MFVVKIKYLCNWTFGEKKRITQSTKQWWSEPGLRPYCPQSRQCWAALTIHHFRETPRCRPSQQTAHFWSTNREEFVLDRPVDSFSSCGCERRPKRRDERHLETIPPLHTTPQRTTGLGVYDFRPHTQAWHWRSPPFQSSEAETSAVIFGALSGAVANDNFDKPKLFGSFFLFFYLWAPVGLIGIPAMTTMWADPFCGTDSWHSRRLTSRRPEVGSDLEQIRGFSALRLGLYDGSSCKTSKIARRGMVPVVSRQLDCGVWFAFRTSGGQRWNVYWQGSKIKKNLFSAWK